MGLKLSLTTWLKWLVVTDSTQLMILILAHYTYHPVSYNTVEYGGNNSYWDEVTEDFC